MALASKFMTTPTRKCFFLKSLVSSAQWILSWLLTVEWAMKELWESLLRMLGEGEAAPPPTPAPSNVGLTEGRFRETKCSWEHTIRTKSSCERKRIV